ncbi:hypothetical protein D9M69_570680 [compost metagenome]
MDLFQRHAALRPGSSAGEYIDEQRLKTIQRFRELRVFGLRPLELLPQAQEFAGLRRRQQAEQPRRGPGFLFGLPFARGSAMDRKIAGIYLDDVMQQEHPDDPVGINRPIGILVQDQGVHCQVPGMLGRILLAAPVQQRRLPDDGFQPVDFPQEAQLFFQCSRLHDSPRLSQCAAARARHSAILPPTLPASNGSRPMIPISR